MAGMHTNVPPSQGEAHTRSGAGPTHAATASASGAGASAVAEAADSDSVDSEDATWNRVHSPTKAAARPPARSVRTAPRFSCKNG